MTVQVELDELNSRLPNTYEFRTHKQAFKITGNCFDPDVERRTRRKLGFLDLEIQTAALEKLVNGSRSEFSEKPGNRRLYTEEPEEED